MTDLRGENMEYSMLSTTDKINMINERILNLEQLKFHNETLLLEHEAIGLFDEESVISINAQISMYTQQVSVLGQIKVSLEQE
jgi:hypothetical protein